MTIYELYTTTAGSRYASEPDFLTAVNLSIAALITRFGERDVLLRGADGAALSAMHESCPVRDAFIPALCDGIMFRLTGDAGYRSSAAALAEEAHLSCWRKRMKRIRVRRSF